MRETTTTGRRFSAAAWQEAERRRFGPPPFEDEHLTPRALAAIFLLGARRNREISGAAGMGAGPGVRDCLRRCRDHSRIAVAQGQVLP